MTRQLIYQLKDFEIFVERLEKFVNDVKKDEELIANDSDFTHYDLRNKDGDPFRLPRHLEDYFDMWEDVKKCYSAFMLEENQEKIENIGMNWTFFDLYWNDIENNSAYYQGDAFAVYFDRVKGIYYED